MNEQVRFPMLSAARFAEANERARNAIRTGLEPPEFEQFRGAVVSKYPRWFLGGVVFVLIIVLGLSFVISAGKQAAAAGMLFDHLPAKFGRLSELWASISVGSMLFLSELGSLLFLVGAGTVAQNMPKAKIIGRQVNVIAWVLRAFALLCAWYAVSSNATITALDSVPQAAVLQWTITIGIPLIVLGVGILLEVLLVDMLASRNARVAIYNNALQDYQSIHSNPTKHASWNSVLADELWREMTRYKRDKDMLETLAGDDRTMRATFIVLEFQAQRRAETIDWNADTQSLLLDAANRVASVSATVSDSTTSAQLTRSSQRGAIVAKPAQVGPAVAKAKAWLVEHPEHGLSLRDAADQAGVSKDTMARAINDSQ